jgi:hypothetical protein
MILWVLALGEGPVRMERMIFFELLVQHIFLPYLLSLLDFMILMETLKSCVFLVLLYVSWRSSLCYALWMERAFSQFNMVF